MISHISQVVGSPEGLPLDLSVGCAVVMTPPSLPPMFSGLPLDLSVGCSVVLTPPSLPLMFSGLPLDKSVGVSVADLIRDMVPDLMQQLQLALEGKDFIISKTLVRDKALTKHDIRVEFRYVRVGEGDSCEFIRYLMPGGGCQCRLAKTG